MCRKIINKTDITVAKANFLFGINLNAVRDVFIAFYNLDLLDLTEFDFIQVL